MITDVQRFNDSVICFLLISNDRLNAGCLSGMLCPACGLSPGNDSDRVASKGNSTTNCETVFQKCAQKRSLGLKIRTGEAMEGAKNWPETAVYPYQYGIDY